MKFIRKILPITGPLFTEPLFTEPLFSGPLVAGSLVAGSLVGIVGWGAESLAIGWQENVAERPPATATAAQTAETPQTLVIQERQVIPLDNAADLERWTLLDDGWKLSAADQSSTVPFLSLQKKASNYHPPFRSPTHLALYKPTITGSFQWDLQVRSTHPDYGHRDVVIFLGYQSPGDFYYIHLAKKKDDHAHQIFVVNQADRTKISTFASDGIDWDDDWHTVRVIRDVDSGRIAVYFDDSPQPVLEAFDRRFVAGQIGVGSFDDTADFNRFVLSPLALTPGTPR